MNITLGCYPFRMSVNLYDSNCVIQWLTRNVLELINSKKCYNSKTYPIHALALCSQSRLTSESDDCSDISESIISPPTWTWHILCANMNTAHGEFPELWLSLNGKGILLYFFPQELFNFQSHSQHLWLWRSTSHIMDLLHFFSSCCVLFH